MRDYTPATDGPDLYNVLNEDLTPEDDGVIDFHGYHITPQGRGVYHVQPDGHVGTVFEFERDEYDEVLHLVKDLIRRVVVPGMNIEDTEERVEWAGKILTRKEEDVEQRPDLYMKIPEEAY